VRREWRDAIRELDAAVRLDPTADGPAVDLAMMLAACPDSSVRDPARAGALAERAVQITQSQDAASLDATGVAYAAIGQFDRAIEAARAARAVVASLPLLVEIERRMMLYQSRRPYILP